MSFNEVFFALFKAVLRDFNSRLMVKKHVVLRYGGGNGSESTPFLGVEPLSDYAGIFFYCMAAIMVELFSLMS